MIFRNLNKIPHQMLKHCKFLYLNVTFSFSTHTRLFSAKPVNLSFLKIEPDKVTNSTPVVILPGVLGSKQNWRSLGKAIAMKSGRQIYALDARNHGDSPHSDYFSYELMCEDVKHFTKSQSIQNIVLVGHSMGGRTAMKLALTEQELVDKLVVVDVSPADMPKSLFDKIPEYMSAMKEAVATAQNLGLPQARKVIDEYLMQSIPQTDIRQFLLTNLVERDQKIEWKPNIDVLMKTFNSEIRTTEFSGYYLGESLFICGGNSPYVKEEHHPLIKQHFPKAEIIVIPGAGHWVHSEKPSEFLEALCNFLKCN